MLSLEGEVSYFPRRFITVAVLRHFNATANCGRGGITRYDVCERAGRGGGGVTTCEVGKALTPPLCCALVVTATKPQAFNQQKDQVWDSAAGRVNADRVECGPHLIGPVLGCRRP